MTMPSRLRRHLLPYILVCAGAVPAWAHDDQTPHKHPAGPAAAPFEFVVEPQGPPTSPPPRVRANDQPVSGQGYWTFAAQTNGVLPIPKSAQPFVKGAHAGLVVDAERDIVYWGLERVGWIAFRERLSHSEVIPGHPAIARGNLHGADLLPRPGKLPLVAAADNVDGEVYVSDTTFKEIAVLGTPHVGEYLTPSEYHPTDAAFGQSGQLFVTDGYGKAWVFAAGLDPLRFVGEPFVGKRQSQTPHGIAYDPARGSLLVAARPEGQVQSWSLREKTLMMTRSLPAGSTVCDIRIWGDYALAPCLDGPNGTPGPIYILNLRTQTIASTIRPKQDLGYTQARHIHSATWYLSGEGESRELAIVFSYWNPGGIGVLKLAAPKGS